MSIAHNDRIKGQCFETIIWQIFYNQFPAIIFDRSTLNDQMIQFDVISQPKSIHIWMNEIENHFRWRIRINSSRKRMVGELHQLVRHICSAWKWKIVLHVRKRSGLDWMLFTNLSPWYIAEWIGTPYWSFPVRSVYHHVPPMVSVCSNTVTLKPCCNACLVAAKPDVPAPITAIFKIDDIFFFFLFPIQTIKLIQFNYSMI